MDSDAGAVALLKSQAACLFALRAGNASSSQIAKRVGVSAKEASIALCALEARGLAERGADEVWRVTGLGESCRVSAKARKGSLEKLREPSANGRRLLDLLERPMEGRTIARKLGLSRQGGLNVIRRLHAQGVLKFGEPGNPSWWVMRADDRTPLLTREQERVLSATPGEYATNTAKIQRRTLLPKDRVEAALAVLVGSGFVEAVGEFNGAALYTATVAGVAHPQNRPDIRDAEPPHLPVYSDRVRSFLSAIHDAGALRIKDLRHVVQESFQGTNALIQYLKRKGLIQKTNASFEAPYVLTEMGSLTLAEMTQPGQLKHGYSPDAVKAPNPIGPASPRGAAFPPVRRPKKANAEKPPRQGLHSERVRAVLSVLADAEALRIKEVSDLLRWPLQSTNSVLQYLKRKALVEKRGDVLGAPFALTPLGRITLAQMTQRRAA